MKIVYFGTPDFAVESLDAIHHSHHQVVGVVTIPDRAAGRGQKLSVSPVKQYALDHSIPLLQPERLRDEGFLEALRMLQADCFVVVAFRMLPEVVWNMPKHGTFNLHASLLPCYRGAAPINWAIIRGEQETGVTTFLLNHHIDEGAILLQARTPIQSNDNAGSLHDRLAQMGRTLVVQTLDGLEGDTLTPTPQPTIDNPQRQQAPKIFTADRRVRFDQPAARVVDFVRGMAPYPAAFIELRSASGQVNQYKLFEVEAETTQDSHVGELKTDSKTFIKIGTTDGFIKILSLQMNGKRKNSTEEFLRGNNVEHCELVD